MRLAILILLAAPCAIAWPKQVIARDILVTGSYLADAATEPCYKPAPCSDKSIWFPPHPTRWQGYRAAITISGLFVAVNHLQHHFANTQTVNTLDWFETGMLVTNEMAYDVPSNLRFKETHIAKSH